MRIRKSVAMLTTGIALCVASPFAAIVLGAAAAAVCVVTGVTMIFVGPRSLGREDDIIRMLENKEQRKVRRDNEERRRIARDIYVAEGKLINIAARFSETRLLISDNARAQLARAIVRSTQILAIIRDEDKGHAAEEFASQYLAALESFVELYTRFLSRDIALAKEALEHSESTTLPGIVDKLDQLYSQLHVGDIAKLATLDTEISVSKKIELTAEAPAEATLWK
jgi:hypothetical protein